MAIVINVLKDGTIVQDMTGHIVRIRDAEATYNLMTEINRKGESYYERKNSKCD